MSVGARTVRGMIWAYGSYIAGRALVLVATAILARLLTPSDFGIVALALVAIALLEVVKDFGVIHSLIVIDEAGIEQCAETAWTFSLGLAIVLAVGVAAASPLVADFFGEDRLAPLLAVLALNLPLGALGSTHYVLAQKRLDFRSRTIAEMADAIVRGSASIAMAATGFGAWSIVLGYLVGTAVTTATLWALVPWRPRVRLRLHHLRELIGFGGVVTAVSAIATVITYLDDLFVGRELGTPALGLYTIAFRIPELVVENLASVAGVVLFPAFAAVEPRALANAFLTSLRYLVAIVVPAALGLALMAEPLVLIVFGDQWRGAVGAMQVLAVYSAIYTLGIPAGIAFKATRRPGVLLWLSIPRLALLALSLVLFVDEGIVAVALCQLVGAAALSALNLVLAVRLLHADLGGIVRAATAPLLAGAAMAAAVVGLDRLVDGDFLRLLVAGGGGLVVYAGCIKMLAPDIAAGVRTRLRAQTPARVEH